VTERTRRVGLEGPVNFRDLGGYPAAGERRVRWGRLYRSDSLHQITTADAPRLLELGVRTAVDFRAADEIERVGIGVLGDLSVEHVHCPTFDRLHSDEPGPRTFPASTAADFYVYMLERGGGSYVAALRALAAPGALPAVFYCAAGKDRTGVFAALVLGLLGVPDDEVIGDYALTGEVLERIRELRVARQRPDDEARYRDLPPDLLYAHPHVMEATLAHVRARWGSWEGYAAAGGVEPVVLERLRAELLEPAG
jgi:protein-tyrosine phosphatase